MSLNYKPHERKSVQFSFAITPEMHASIKQASETANVSAGELVRCALARGVPLYLDAVRKSRKGGGKSGGKTAGKRGV